MCDRGNHRDLFIYSCYQSECLVLAFAWPADGPVCCCNTLATQGQWIQFPRCKEKPSKGTCSFSGFVLLPRDRIPAVVPVLCCKGPWSCCWFVHRNRELLVQGDKWEMLRSTCVPQGAALEMELVCYVF